MALDPFDLEKYKECALLCAQTGSLFTNQVILVNTTSQRLHFIASGIDKSYPVSTSYYGVGQEEGSYQTPLGLHRICEKSGDVEHPFAIFKNRAPTGETASPLREGDLIVGRILRLEGLQERFNRGKNCSAKVVDSLERYIYIHGTNDTESIGTPVSKGCVRMVPSDVVDLFDQVAEQSIVLIY